MGWRLDDVMVALIRGLRFCYLWMYYLPMLGRMANMTVVLIRNKITLEQQTAKNRSWK